MTKYFLYARKSTDEPDRQILLYKINYPKKIKKEAPSEAGNRNFTNWLSVLNEIRTFFKENPDAEF